VLERVGLSEVRWAYAAADIGPDEALDLSLMAHLPDGSLLKQAAGLCGPAPVELLSLAPPEALSAAVGSFDVNGLYQLVLGAVRELAPDGYVQMRAQIDMVKKGMGIDFERDLLAQMTGQFASFEVRVPPSEAPVLTASVFGGSVPSVLQRSGAVYVGLKNPAVVERMVAQSLELGGLDQMVEREQFQGRWTYRLELPGQVLAWSFADKQFVLAESRTALRTALSRLGSTGSPSLASEARYQEALARHPQASFVSVADSKGAAAAMLGATGMIVQILQMGAMSKGIDAPWVKYVAEIPAPDPAAASRYLSGVLTSAFEVGPSFVKFRVSAR
jgi:hypothetical protein